MLHHPPNITDAAAAQEIIAVVAGIVIPLHVLQWKNLFAIEGVEDVLVRQYQLLTVLCYIIEQHLRPDFLPPEIQIHQQHAGVIVVLFRSQTQLIDAICQLRLARVSSGGKEVSIQLCLPQWPEGIDNQDIRVKIEDPVQLRGRSCGASRR